MYNPTLCREEEEEKDPHCIIGVYRCIHSTGDRHFTVIFSFLPNNWHGSEYKRNSMGKMVVLCVYPHDDGVLNLA